MSGGAYGIDAAAHRGVLASSGLTVAVLACGVDVSYPKSNSALFDRIAEYGLLVSELPPGCSPTKLRFLARNRLIAASTQGTIVVEAAVRSGALNSAGWAEQCGRPVLAVPGPITSRMSEGVHLLVRERNAVLVTNVADIQEAIAPIGTQLTRYPHAPAASDRRPRLRRPSHPGRRPGPPRGPSRPNSSNSGPRPGHRPGMPGNPRGSRPHRIRRPRLAPLPQPPPRPRHLFLVPATSANPAGTRAA